MVGRYLDDLLAKDNIDRVVETLTALLSLIIDVKLIVLDAQQVLRLDPHHCGERLVHGAYGKTLVLKVDEKEAFDDSCRVIIVVKELLAGPNETKGVFRLNFERLIARDQVFNRCVNLEPLPLELYLLTEAFCRLL